MWIMSVYTMCDSRMFLFLCAASTLVYHPTQDFSFPLFSFLIPEMTPWMWVLENKLRLQCIISAFFLRANGALIASSSPCFAIMKFFSYFQQNDNNTPGESVDVQKWPETHNEIKGGCSAGLCVIFLVLSFGYANWEDQMHYLYIENIGKKNSNKLREMEQMWF